MAASPSRVVVFAAASTTEAMETLARRFGSRHGVDVVASFAASSTLARQIESGAPADLIVSADRRWMDYLATRGLIDAASRCNLFGNRLVLIAPADSAIELAVAPGFRLDLALGDRRLAIGDPDHVPAGVYARKALETLGVWPSLENRLVRAADVRAALALVARGEAAAGIVYATDATVSDRVRVVDRFPADSHDPIVYPLARIVGADNPATAGFLAFLASDEARMLVKSLGFSLDVERPCQP